MPTVSSTQNRTVLLFGRSASLRTEIINRIQSARSNEGKPDAGVNSSILPEITPGVTHYVLDAGDSVSNECVLGNSSVAALILVVDVNTCDHPLSASENISTDQELHGARTSQLEADLALCSALRDNEDLRGVPMVVLLANAEACVSRISADALREWFPPERYLYNAGEDPALDFGGGGVEQSTKGLGFLLMLFTKRIGVDHAVYAHFVERSWPDRDWDFLKACLRDIAGQS